MAVVYWLLMIISAVFTGMKGSQIHLTIKHRQYRTAEKKAEFAGVILMFICCAALLVWSWYQIWHP